MNEQKRNKILKNPVLTDSKWYHAIEVSPGVFTKEQGYRNVALSRELLAKTEIEGKRCLDIGAMDGMMSILMTRRGAARVSAYDRLGKDMQVDLTPRIDYLKAALETDFDYVNGFPLGLLSTMLDRKGIPFPFDVVLFSGVLYHMYDPMAGLAIARGMVRNGGILIVETAAMHNDQMINFFNASGIIHRGDKNYWHISDALLDYLLRFFSLKPLDCKYYNAGKDDDGRPLIRIAIACQAMEEAIPYPGDDWMVGKRHLDNKELFDAGRLVSEEPPIKYDVGDSKSEKSTIGTVDLYNTIENTPQLETNPSNLVLHLKDKK